MQIYSVFSSLATVKTSSKTNPRLAQSLFGCWLFQKYVKKPTKSCEAIQLVDSLINYFNESNSNNPPLIDFINKYITEDIYNQSVSKDYLDDESNLKLEKVARAKGAMKAKVFQQLFQCNRDEINQIDKSEQQKLKKYIESAVDKCLNKISSNSKSIIRLSWYQK